MSNTGNAVKERSGLDIMADVLDITKRMSSKCRDVNVLDHLLDQRGQLMEEYDKLKTSNPLAAAQIEKAQPEISRMLDEIRKLNSGINSVLTSLRAEAKGELESSVVNQKVLGYTNNAILSSGSYLDIKK